VRAGASESMASTKYSKVMRSASRRSWPSSAPGSSSSSEVHLHHIS
jgi:hypothetical protein